MTEQVGALTMSAECNEIFAAMADAQAQVQAVTKDKKVSAGPIRYTYADLASAYDACREALSAHGVYLNQALETRLRDEIEGVDKKGQTQLYTRRVVIVTTTLCHRSGQWLSCTLQDWPDQHDVQGTGSAITYLRRYSLLAMVGLAPEDDDGRASMRGDGQQRKRTNGGTVNDEVLRTACGAAMQRGWTQDQVADCLQYHGSADAKVATVPPEARLDCLEALKGNPRPIPGHDVDQAVRPDGPEPPPPEQQSARDDFAPAVHPLDKLSEAAERALEKGTWSKAELAALVTWGVGRMTAKAPPETMQGVPLPVATALVDTIKLPFANWRRSVNSAELDTVLAAISPADSDRILGL